MLQNHLSVESCSVITMLSINPCISIEFVDIEHMGSLERCKRLLKVGPEVTLVSQVLCKHQSASFVNCIHVADI